MDPSNDPPYLSHYLDAVDTGVLRNVPVLVQAFLDHFALAQHHTELNVLEHDGLHDIQCITARALRQDNLVERLQGHSLLASST